MITDSFGMCLVAIAAAHNNVITYSYDKCLVAIAAAHNITGSGERSMYTLICSDETIICSKITNGRSSENLLRYQNFFLTHFSCCQGYQRCLSFFFLGVHF